MGFPIELIVYPLKEGVDVYTSARIVGLSPVALSAGLVIELHDGVSLKLSSTCIYHAPTGQYSGHAYLYSKEHITLEKLTQAFEQTGFSVNCSRYIEASSLSPRD